MFEVEGIAYSFHHLGVPTSEVHEGERYSPVYRMYTCDAPTKLLRLQWHRFEPGSPLHPLLQTQPHVAFKVSDLDRAIAGKTVILGPYEPIPGLRVAAIEDGGMAVELIQTLLTDEEIWSRANTSSRLSDSDPRTRRMLQDAAARRG
jgi:hypothetical protein